MADWLDLGSVTPSLNNWITFPQAMVAGGTARVVFENLQAYPLYFRTFVVIRPVWSVSGGFVRGRGLRFYPNIDSPDIMTEFPIPQGLQDEGYFVRDFEVKKFLRRPYIGRSGEPQYSVRLLDWIGVGDS